MDRASMDTITNPDDLNAIEASLTLKDETCCEVVVVSMGPPPAEGMLRELLARGADRAVLVSAREFGGSDTFATSPVSYTHLDVYKRQVHGTDPVLFSYSFPAGESAMRFRRRR